MRYFPTLADISPDGTKTFHLLTDTKDNHGFATLYETGEVDVVFLESTDGKDRKNQEEEEKNIIETLKKLHQLARSKEIRNMILKGSD